MQTRFRGNRCTHNKLCLLQPIGARELHSKPIGRGCWRSVAPLSSSPCTPWAWGTSSPRTRCRSLTTPREPPRHMRRVPASPPPPRLLRPGRLPLPRPPRRLQPVVVRQRTPLQRTTRYTHLWSPMRWPLRPPPPYAAGAPPPHLVAPAPYPPSPTVARLLAQRRGGPHCKTWMMMLPPQVQTARFGWQ